MKTKYALFLLAVIALCVFAPAAFAQGQAPAGAAPAGPNWIAITAGFSMAIASAGCGLAQGRASAGCSEGIARNPGAAKLIQNMFILALVLIESMALYTFAMMFIRVK
jgi:F-type H+-transporting ATPase subunit c